MGFLNWPVARKVSVVLAALTIVGGVVVAVGFTSVGEIDAKLNEITDVAAPTVETVGDVANAVAEAHKVAVEILADEELEDIARRRGEFDAAAAAFDTSIAELNEIVSDPDLELVLGETVSESADFFNAAEAMFTAHETELNEEILAVEQLAEFERYSLELIAAFEEISDANEAEMQAAEDRADVLATNPTTTATMLNDLIGELFERDYPSVEAAVELEAIVALLEGAAREYMAVEDPEMLESVRAEFTASAEAAQPQFDVLLEMAESAAEREDLAALEARFDAWVANAEADEQLFDTHRDMLAAEAQADRLAELVDDNADTLMATLNQVADIADAVSDGADDSAAETVARAETMMFGAFAAMIAAAVGAVFMVQSTIGRPIRALTEATTQLAEGNLDVQLQATKRKDEVGRMLQALTVFRDNLAKSRDVENERLQAQERQNLSTEVAALVRAASEGDFSHRIDGNYTLPDVREVADGLNHLLETASHGLGEIRQALGALSNADLTYRVPAGLKGEFGELAEAANATASSLNGIIAGVRDAADVVAGQVGGLVDGADSLSGRTASQAASLEETAAAMETMTHTIGTNSEALTTAEGLATKVSEECARGRERAIETRSTVEQIAESSGKINDIINVIDSIAFQTNLLALNASVEAARAGDAGRGFAVVASEVRGLAQRSADAARDISELITESSRRVEKGVVNVKATVELLEAIDGATTELSSAVESVSAAGSEQADTAAEVSSTVSELDTGTQQNASIAEQFARSSSELREQIEKVAGAVAAFQTEGGSAHQTQRAA